MMEALLFYEEEDTLIPNQRIIIDQWCAMAGLMHLMIDRSGTMKRTNRNVFGSIEEAIAEFPDHTWVFMSESADQLLTDYVHPPSNVIYCLGSDTDGFQGLDLSEHTTLRITYADGRSNEWHTATVAPMVIAHRMFN